MVLTTVFVDQHKHMYNEQPATSSKSICLVKIQSQKDYSLMSALGTQSQSYRGLV